MLQHDRVTPSRARANRRAGLTLIEIMLATTVAGTACLAAVAGLLMSLRTADSNLLALQASATVRSIAENLHTVDYQSLFAAELPVDVPSRPSGRLTAEAWNARAEDFRRTPLNISDDLRLNIRPFVTRVTQSDGLEYAQVVLQYEWIDSCYFVPRTRADSFTMLVAPVSAF